MPQEKTPYEKNREILDSYDGSDILHPQVILRRVHHMDNNVLDDDLYRLTVDPYSSNLSYTELGEFGWAYGSLHKFQEQYRKMLEDPTERIHLDALAKSDCRIFIESLWSSSGGNGKSGRYGGMSTKISNKPAIVLVADLFDDTTLLHEAIHNSDLRLDSILYLNDKNFSALKIHHAAIMMIDAQKIKSFRGYDSVKACRNINESYINGQLYIEGLAWITQMPMETLAKEKNHIGKHLKALHALYTEAIMKKQTAILDCFQYWRPSEHIIGLLADYDKDKQKIGKNRDKILKQQKHYWDEMLRFRKEINKLKTRGCADMMLSGDMLYFCDAHGVNSLAPAYLAQHKAEEMYQQCHDDKKAHAEALKSLFAEIKPNDLNHASLFAEKFLACYAYFKKIDKELMAQNYAESLFELPFDTKGKSSIAVRKKLYDAMKSRVNIVEIQAATEASNKHSSLAYIYKINADSITIGDAYIKLKMREMKNVEQKREFAANTIDYAKSLEPYSYQSGRFRAQAVLAMSYLLEEYGLSPNTHELLQAENLKDFQTSEKVVQDLQWLKTPQKKDGLSAETYRWFDAGILNEYCSRPASTFDPNSPDYIPNNYRNKSKSKTAHVRALYEFLALRHSYQAKTHCKTFPEDLRLTSLKPNSDFYRQIRLLSEPSQVVSGPSANNHDL